MRKTQKYELEVETELHLLAQYEEDSEVLSHMHNKADSPTAAENVNAKYWLSQIQSCLRKHGMNLWAMKKPLTLLTKLSFKNKNQNETRRVHPATTKPHYVDLIREA